MAELRAPFPWFGGKSRAAHLIWPRFGQVNNYCEPFAGSLAVLLAAPNPVANETVNDLDGFISNFWRALIADPDAVAFYADWPVNETDLHARHAWLAQQRTELTAQLLADPEYCDARIAGWWVWGLCCWIGSGWCADRETQIRKRPRAARGGRGVVAVSGQKPVLSGPGRGVHQASLQAPYLSEGGRGVHRSELAQKLPYVDKGGRGVHRAELSGQRPCLHEGGTGVHRADLWQTRPYLDRGGRGVHGSAELRDYLGELAARLRRVRVCCGDWSRILTPAVTSQLGTTAVLLDPPYPEEASRDSRLYAVDDLAVAHKVHEWALANGKNPKLRIALCGYDGQHADLPGWECVAWRSVGGYGSTSNGRGRENAARERIWFSPSCSRPQPGLFDALPV